MTISPKERRFNEGIAKLKSHVISQGSYASLDSNILSSTCEDRNESQEASLQKALSKLSLTDKEILLLRHIDDLKWGDIGEILHISEVTARKKGNRALNRLKDNFYSFYSASKKGGES